MRSQKLRYLMVGVLMFAMSWLGYWIGYISANSPGDDVYRIQGHNVANKIPFHNGLLKGLKNQTADIKAATNKLPGFLKDLKNKTSHRSKTASNVPPIKAWDGKAPVDPRKIVPVAKDSKTVDDPFAKKDPIKLRSDHEPPLESLDNVHPVILPEPPKAADVEDRQRPVEPQLKPTGKSYMLVHSGRASKIPGNIHERLQSMPDSVDRESYVFSSFSLPRDPRLRPSIGNGHLATMVHSKEVFMNGLYSGYLNQSHRAVIPSTCSWNITETDPPSNFTRLYTLNTGEGIYSEVSTSATYTLTQRMYAHRTITRLLVVEIDLVRSDTTLPLKLKVKLNRWETSYDLVFQSLDSGLQEVSHKKGRINAPESRLGDPKAMTEVHVVYDHVPDVLAPPSGASRTKWVFLSSIANDKESAFKAYKQGQKLLHEGDALYSTHVQAWGDLWSQGRVDVEGNPAVARAAYGSLYYTLSSLPLETEASWPFVGVSPSGLPLGEHEKDYQGHVLWDQEMWVSPPVLFLHADLARILIKAREHGMEAAGDAAMKASLSNAFKFPAESGFTGIEVSPRRNASRKSLYVSSMVSHAVLQYLCATNDTAALESTLGGLLAGVGHYVVSQLIHNSNTDRYSIYNVATPEFPPDELIVNNSVFVNVAAKEALEAHSTAFIMAGKHISQFEHFAENVYVPFDSKDLYHPAYEGFAMKTKLKQPGGVYAGYPLNTPQVTQVRRRDLEIYESVLSPIGPIMPWNMMLIGWLEVGDLPRAEQIFTRNFGYIQNDFQVWTETNIKAENVNHASNHLSGMGSFLQALIAGYGGFRFYENRLDLNPVLPPGVTGVLYAGVDYLGSSLDFAVKEDSVLVRVVSQRQGAPSLTLYSHLPEEVYTLAPDGQAVTIPRTSATVAASHAKLFPRQV